MLDGWCKGCNVGLNLEFDAAIAGSLVLWCTHLAELWCTGIDGFGRDFVNNGTAALEIFLDAMIPSCLLSLFCRYKEVRNV